MIVKIGDKFYHDRDTPIMIILSNQDIEAIKSMDSSCTSRLCSFPARMDKEQVFKWMDNKEVSKIMESEN